MFIKRDAYLNELILRQNNGLIKIVTGIRRCGKSFLLCNIFYSYLISIGISREHIIIISMDNLENKPLLDANALYEYIKSKIVDKQQYYLIIDEIQEVRDFTPLLNSLLKISNLDVYVTGSNSRFLSSDILTEFRGRGDQIHVNPLSFKEYFEALNMSYEDALNDYFMYGGMPFILNRKTEKLKIDYLKNLFSEIYLKDIKERYKIANDEELEELLNIISSSIGSLTNPTKLENTFLSEKKVRLSKNTINSYLKIFEESFLVKKVNRYDIKGKCYINTPAKYYFVDMGLRNARLNFRQYEETHILENVIYNELITRGFNVDIGVVEILEKNSKNNYIRKQLEIDFIANIGNKKFYIQSAYSLASYEKQEQELRPLRKIDDSFAKIIIVRERIKSRVNEDGVFIIGLKDFLLNENVFSDIYEY